MRFVDPKLESEDKFGKFLIVDMSAPTVNEFNSFPKFHVLNEIKYQRTGWNEDGMYLCYRALPLPSTDIIKQDPYEFQCPLLDNA